MECDYLIVGAGAAGCVLANRLSADPSNRVLLVEAGGSDLTPNVEMPFGQRNVVGNPATDWCVMAEPDPTRDGRVDLWPVGKVLGGGTSINGLVWIRGQRQDYDGWAELGATGWDYESLLRYFRRSESFEGGPDEYRGGAGPVRVSRLRTQHELVDVFVAAGVEAGFGANADPNGADPEGFAPVQTNQREGWRETAARAYLAPVLHRPNLEVRTGVEVSRLLLEGERCAGAVTSGGELRASREVLLSAGAIMSPKLLMLSGIGPRSELAGLGIDVVVEAEGVGRNLQEHPITFVSFFVNVPTLNSMLLEDPEGCAAEWRRAGTGAMTSPVAQAYAFFRSDPSLERPDLQFHFTPVGFDFGPDGLELHERPACMIAANLCRPNARGSVTLRSADPSDPPRISHDLMGDADDVARLAKGCEIAQRVFETEAFAPYLLEQQLPPAPPADSDGWAAYARATAGLAYHPSGTCRMGSDDGAVVDPSLRVRGIAGLRVVDASVMPRIVSANTNATVIAIGERASDLILAGDDS
ncbi:MAG: GMC family oxidoreductase N-terminal domain-containing protein [bacterium]|nr:GMC family oxidoreductase N-terminal domain-containing protein [bacterium]